MNTIFDFHVARSCIEGCFPVVYIPRHGHIIQEKLLKQKTVQIMFTK